MITTNGTILVGDWRRRMGTKTDAHLWPKPAAGSQKLYDRQQPMCSKAIPRYRTVAVRTGRPCTDCLVAKITARP